MNTYFKPVAGLWLLLAAAGLQAAEAGETPAPVAAGKPVAEVAPRPSTVPSLLRYDGVADSLSVKAEAVSQKKLLRSLALQSGLEVIYDEEADRPLTITLEEVKLEPGLKQLLRGTNYILRYGKNAAGEPLLLGMIVLPAGKSDRSAARPLVTQDAEAVHHAKASAATPAAANPGKGAERWQARLAELPPEVQAQLQKRAEEKLAREQARREKRAEQHAQKKEQREARQEAAQQAREKRLQKLTPEQRTQLEQQRQQVREQVRQQVKSAESQQ
jgi:hypothetical protein